MEFFDVIKNRYSNREYEDRQISDEELRKVLDAGMAAPVALGNPEGYLITVIQKKELLDRIDEAAAQSVEREGYHPLYNAPTLVMVSARIEDEEINMAISETCACIVENMHLAATALGLGSIFMMSPLWAFDIDEELPDLLNLPEEFFPIATLALGYPNGELKRTKPLGEIRTEVIK